MGTLAGNGLMLLAKIYINIKVSYDSELNEEFLMSKIMGTVVTLL